MLHALALHRKPSSPGKARQASREARLSPTPRASHAARLCRLEVADFWASAFTMVDAVCLPAIAPAKAQLSSDESLVRDECGSSNCHAGR